MIHQQLRNTLAGLLGLVVLGLVPALSLADERPGRPDAPRVRATDVLETVWPGHPEWVAMLTDILEGSQLGPDEGWFKKAVAQTRYPWARVQTRLDRDGDGRIVRDEFPGGDADFTSLDRDGDGSLSAIDFDHSAHALTPTLGSLVFARADGDGDGKLTREEVAALFQEADRGGLGFLSLADVQRTFAMPARPSSGSAGPSRWTLVRGLFRQEIGSLQAGPTLDERAPDFRLKTVDGRDAITLSDLVGPRPVVLIFGNFTCGPFRNQGGNIEKLYQRYRNRATFVMVYTREAHPIDGWHMESNDRVGVTLRQPQSYDERAKVAQRCRQTLGLGMPVLVDKLDDAVGARYSGMPSRLYLIDRQGVIAYKSGRGPFGFKLSELEQSLILLLLEQDEKRGT